MMVNTIESGEYIPNNSDISAKSGDNSQQDKKHILSSF